MWERVEFRYKSEIIDDISRLFMKLFKTNSIETVESCQDPFGFDKPSVWARRVRKFDRILYVG